VGCFISSHQLFKIMESNKLELGYLVSALQKAIRRSDEELALKVANELWERDRIKLLRRLPIIAVEDVGWKSIADTVYVCKKAGLEKSNYVVWKKEWIAKDLVMGNVLRLVRSDKDKDAGWIFNVARNRSKELTFLKSWKERFLVHLGKDNVVKAASVLLPAMRKLGYKDVYSVLQEIAAKYPIECIESIDSCRFRTAIGCREVDAEIILGGALLALFRSEALVFDVEKIEKVESLPWYVFDSHTKIGKIAQAVVAKKEMSSLDRIALLQFLFEGAQIDPVSNEQEFYEEALAYIVGRGKNEDQQEMLKKAMNDWVDMKSDIEKMVRIVARKEGVKVDK